MSDWPQLEHRLVESARRRSWRRTTHMAIAAVPIAIALATAVLLVGGSPTPKRIPGDERAVASPTSTATPTGSDRSRSVFIDPKTGEIIKTRTMLERSYSVFRSPATAQDRPPYSPQQRKAVTRDCGRKHGPLLCPRLETARLAYRGGDVQIFLMQGDRDDELCTMTFEGGHLSTMGCAPANADRLSKPLGSYGPPHGSQPARGYTVFPDGVERVAYTLADGTIVVRNVERNLAYVTGPAAITSLSWASGDRRYVQQVIDFDRNDPAVTKSCPKLEPRPDSADEPVTHAARTAASAIYALAAGEITVSHVRPATNADVNETRRRACGEALVERTLVVDLQFTDRRKGSLLVGFRDGSPIVWAQID